MVAARSRHGCVANPDLRVGPSGALDRFKCRTKECPLDAHALSIGRLQICSDVPPLDPEIRMRLVVFWKDEFNAACGNAEAFGI
jgi:hypothetical protein